MIYRRDLDNQGCCNQWQHGIRTINDQYPDDNRDFDINAGDGIEITPATAGITIAVKAPLPGPMVYQGTVGTGGTIASLSAANVTNIGWTYLAITAGSTPDDTPKSYEIGDMIISNGEEWTVVPAGDDPVLWSDIQNKPTTLSGYGITDAVNTTGDQTGIAGAKTWTGVHNWSNPLTVTSTASDCFKQKNSNLPTNRATFGTNNIDIGILSLGNASGINFGQIEYIEDTSLRALGLRLYSPTDNAWKGIFVQDRNGTTYATALARAYNSANTNDIVTIGSLASNPNVVHTTGNESIAGYKTFSADAIYVKDNKHKMIGSNESTKNNTHISTVSPDGTTEIRMTVIANDGGTGSVTISKFINGSYVSSTTIGTI